MKLPKPIAVFLVFLLRAANVVHSTNSLEVTLPDGGKLEGVSRFRYIEKNLQYLFPLKQYVIAIKYLWRQFQGSE